MFHHFLYDKLRKSPGSINIHQLEKIIRVGRKHYWMLMNIYYTKNKTLKIIYTTFDDGIKFNFYFKSFKTFY